MARSKNSSTSNNITQGQRDFQNPYQSLDSLLAFKLRGPPVLLPVPSTTTPTIVRSVGDRRLWRPDETTRPPHTARPGASRVQVGKALQALRFADPRFVAICARRKIRKQIMFALRKTRKGSGARKRKNFWSAVSC
ncbi:hypothetical protein [robinz microvirus RP_172]|nr:hypothetical protein [robinz microvirus RP_172]